MKHRFKAQPFGFDLSNIEVCLARPDKRVGRDTVVTACHYPGFKGFAGRGLRHVVLWHGQWVAVAGWQTGAFNCTPRDRWIGRAPAEPFRRLHLIGNNARFLMPCKPGVFPGLARFALTRMTERLSADKQVAYGHPLLPAERLWIRSLSREPCTRWRTGTSRAPARAMRAATAAIPDRMATPGSVMVCRYGATPAAGCARPTRFWRRGS